MRPAQAFDEYLDESARAYVERQEPLFAEGVERIRRADGIASLAHPIRLREDLASVLPELCDFGLNAIEVHHSDHDPKNTALCLQPAEQYGLIVTGGSDFDGATKPDVALGTGRKHNLSIPPQVANQLKPVRLTYQDADHLSHAGAELVKPYLIRAIGEPPA